MLERIQADVLKRIYRYWDEKRGGRRAPARADIDPIELGSALANIFLLDVEEAPRRYRVRLMGEAFVEEYGETVAGKYLDEVDLGDEKAAILAAYDALVENCEPLYVTSEFVKADGRRLHFERLALPLSSDGETVDKILGGMVAKSLSMPNG